MENILQNAIQSAQTAEIAFSKFITANDTGSTGAHQYGYHIHKQAWPLMFDKPGEKGTNSENFITIKWQKDFETNSRFIYYGVGTRDEYRLTRFGKGFPYLSDDNIGDLLILCKISASYYEAFVIQGDEDIEQFFAALNITVNQTNQIIPRQTILPSEDRMNLCFKDFLERLSTDFPSTFELSKKARACYNKSYDITLQLIQEDPDKRLIEWLDAEYQLFKIIENDRYDSRIKTPFNSVGELVETANTILNRRKSRAGKSLEHHLAEIFTLLKISFESQVITEDNKRPDFLFPGVEAYANSGYDENKLVMLASKTTCKDRWRQVLNEADRIRTKHLFTLQQGVSTNQLKEMTKYNVQLVVPKSYLSSYPSEYRSKIMILEQFLTFTKSTQL